MSEGRLLGVDAGSTENACADCRSEGARRRERTTGLGKVGLNSAFIAYAQVIDAALRTASITRNDISAAGYALGGLSQ